MTGVHNKGNDLVIALEAQLHDISPDSHAWCYRHNRRCKIPVLPAERVIHAAGTTCVDWSNRSAKPMRWLGANMIPFMAWLRIRCSRAEQLIVHECVAGHPSEELLGRSLSVSHVITSFVLCPSSLLGHPCHRLRRYKICIGKGAIITPLARPPSEIWSFKIVATASIYFNAEPFEVDCYLASTGAHSFRALLPRGSLQRSWHGVKCLPLHVCVLKLARCMLSYSRPQGLPTSSFAGLHHWIPLELMWQTSAKMPSMLAGRSRRSCAF